MIVSQTLRLHVANLFSHWHLSWYTVRLTTAAPVSDFLAMKDTRMLRQLCSLLLAAKHKVLKVDFRALEPLVRGYEPPDKDYELVKYVSNEILVQWIAQVPLPSVRHTRHMSSSLLMRPDRCL